MERDARWEAAAVSWQQVRRSRQPATALVRTGRRRSSIKDIVCKLMRQRGRRGWRGWGLRRRRRKSETQGGKGLRQHATESS